MAKTFNLNTGEPRSITGHVVSGAIASGLISGTVNYTKVQKAEITSEKAIRNTVKHTAQGGIATGAAIAAANYIGQPDGGGWLKALSAISVGMAGVYAVEVLDQLLEQKALENDENEAIDSDEVIDDSLDDSSELQADAE